MKYNPKIIIPTGEKYLYTKEISAAKILAIYFQKNVEILPKGINKTPDFLIGNQKWELKSPTGNGKHTVQHALQDASKQSQYVVFDARFSKINTNKLKIELKYQFRLIKPIKRLLCIEKSTKVIEIFR